MNYFVIAILIIIPSLAQARILSFDDCLKLLLENNADLKAAEASVQAIETQIGSARSAFLPQVNTALGMTESNGATSSGSSGGFLVGQSSSTNKQSTTYAASVSATQNLFNGLQDIEKITQAQTNLKAAKANLQIIKARISYDFKNAFYSFLYAKEATKLTHEILKRRQDNLRMVQLRFESGRENKGSVLLSEAYFFQAQYDELQAANAQRISLSQLARVVGLDEFADLEIEGSIPTVETVQTASALKHLAIETPDYQQAVLQVESTESAITIARAQFMPQLNLTGNFSKQGPDFFPDATQRWSVALNLTFPIFTGGRDYYALQNATASWRSQVNTRVNLSRQVLVKLEQTYAALIESITKYKVDDSFRKATQLRAEIARERYSNGLLAFENWDIIESDLINRQKVFLQTKRDQAIASASFEQAQGKGVIP